MVAVSKLFHASRLGPLTLANKVVMAPLTRSRSEPKTGVPTPIVKDYYEQRSSAGLVITEGTQPSYEGQGYPRTPGIHDEAQIAAWRAITDAVHAKGGKMVLQLMHVGRIAHSHNRHESVARIPAVAPSAVAPEGTQMYTDEEGMVDIPTPRALETAEVQKVVDEHVHAARCAMKAGFDGVEIHGANGYLINQFLATKSNQRADKYGGSVENRVRFAAEIVAAVGDAIGLDRTAIRLSPGHGTPRLRYQHAQLAHVLFAVLPCSQPSTT